MVSRQQPPDELGPFQFAVLLLSLALLLALVMEWVFDVPGEVTRLVLFLDAAVCAVLFVDFVVRFRAAPSKLAFMKWGWIDLLASIPAFEIARAGRVLRIVRVIRLIMAVGTFRRFLQILWASKTQAGLVSVVVIAFLVMSFGSIGILFAELNSPDGNIRTAEDALWWSLTTVTTVGYGDHFPVTTAGRIVAGLLMICGIGIFGSLGGIAASFFLGGGKDEPASLSNQEQMLARIASLQQEIEALRRDRMPPSG